MADIAKAANVTTSNIYHYYTSKLQIFYEVYSPILISRLEKLEKNSKSIADPEERLKFILRTLWIYIPSEEDGFSHNLIQAIVTSGKGTEKPHALLSWCESFVSTLIQGCLPPHRKSIMKDSSLSFLIWMIFDGFSVNLGMGEDRDSERLISSFCDLLLGNVQEK